MASRAHSMLDMARMLTHMDRPEIEAIVEAAIGILDAFDGDADDEPDADRCDAEDDHPGPVAIQWMGIKPTSLDDDHGLSLIFGADQRRPSISESAAAHSLAAGQILWRAKL